jgi:hypothetical protein
MLPLKQPLYQGGFVLGALFQVRCRVGWQSQQRYCRTVAGLGRVLQLHQSRGEATKIDE